MVITELLNPKAEEIKDMLKEKDKEDNGFVERSLYCSCIEEMKSIKNLHNIKSSDIGGVITVFLIRWGNMIRVLGKSGWQKGLREEISKLSDDLEEVRKKDIVDNDLDKYEDKIKKCYLGIIGCLKKTADGRLQYTATSKVLHLIAPGFFPMWDCEIRKKVLSEYRKKNNIKIEKSEQGENEYYMFMKIIKNFITCDTRRSKEITDLIPALKSKRRYENSKIRIVDRYFWLKTDNAKKTK